MPIDVSIRPFLKELDFEKALVQQLTEYHGWEPAIMLNPSEEDLIKNWAAIIFNMNRHKNLLGDYPLTDTEMQQVINFFNGMHTPYLRNQAIITGEVTIRRDNKDDIHNYGKEVVLKIFDPREIRAGQSSYQIVRQPRFNTRHPLASDRRGDVMLLINGMPLIHIELKRSGVDVTQAVNQIKKYTHEGVFSQGIFSLVQVFVAMTPEKTLYFANPGDESKFTPTTCFHWADSNNDEMHNWQDIAAHLLSIPMAHQLVGYYTIADDKDETLKVLRPYQYYAANRICQRVAQTNWDEHQHQGGFIWHTTGSGKTMTSFKAAQLIAHAGDADKVVFLLDRIELSTQSADEYRGFANADDNVLDTEDTASLVSALESDDKSINLIVTSIQKMSRVNTANHIADSRIQHINRKRVVFIIDECHRSVGGAGKSETGSGMLLSIKRTFPRAILFGFTGTPIFPENARGEITTGDIFGDNLHKYTLANGIPDGNVLGFDLYREDTFKEDEIRDIYAKKALGLDDDAEIDKLPQNVIDEYRKLRNETDMIKVETAAKSLYQSRAHHISVMNKIVEERPRLSHDGKFHAILATKNIPEAIEYYNLFKENYPEYNVAAIFDDSIDNNGGSEYKEDAILEMLDDYNQKFGTQFQQSTYARYKKDVAKRLAHKAPYKHLTKAKQLDMLIVVTQMLTGYDSKWVNALYVDKVLYYVDVIQAFSRTNRLFGPDKPFGVVKYFTRPNLMDKNIDDALNLYVDQPMSKFTDKLERNLEAINEAFANIEPLFTAEGITYFDRLPQAPSARNKFAKEFIEMTHRLEAAKMQGFVWEQLDWDFQHTDRWVTLHVVIDEQTYQTLRQRYKELFEDRQRGERGDEDVYQLESYIVESGAGTIDAEYINANFQRYIKYLYTNGPDSQAVKQRLSELHRSFASFSQRDQRTAIMILRDIQSGDLRLKPDYTIYDYINEYQERECDQQIRALSEATGADYDKTKQLIDICASGKDINEQGRFEELRNTLDYDRVPEFLQRVKGREIKRIFMRSTMDALLTDFIADADTRKKIIFAYQNENYTWDKDNPQELPEEEGVIPTEEAPTETVTEGEATQTSAQSATVSQPTEQVEPTEEEITEYTQRLVQRNLRRVFAIPYTSAEAVKRFCCFLDLCTIDKYDNSVQHLKTAIVSITNPTKNDPLVYDRALNTFAIGLESYLKKLYYILHREDIDEGLCPKECHMLSDMVQQFSFYRDLRTAPEEHNRNIMRCLDSAIRMRNSFAHNGMIYTSSIDETQQAIQTFLTVYVYYSGKCAQELEERNR